MCETRFVHAATIIVHMQSHKISKLRRKNHLGNFIHQTLQKERIKYHRLVYQLWKRCLSFRLSRSSSIPICCLKLIFLNSFFMDVYQPWWTREHGKIKLLTSINILADIAVLIGYKSWLKIQLINFDNRTCRYIFTKCVSRRVNYLTPVSSTKKKELICTFTIIDASGDIPGVDMLSQFNSVGSWMGWHVILLYISCFYRQTIQDQTGRIDLLEVRPLWA